MSEYKVELTITMIALAAIAALLILMSCGCVSIRPNIEPERLAYLAGKDVTYGLWRFDVLDRGDLDRARPHLEARLAALDAQDEAQLDRAIGTYMEHYVERLAAESDRAVVRELIGEALEDLELRDPTLLDSKNKALAAAVVGGILDGIALVEAADDRAD